MEEEEGEDTAEEAEVEAEAMAVEEGVEDMGEAADMEAAKVAGEASSGIGAPYLWRKVRRSMSRSTRLAEEATGSPASTIS
jgi:hypothetical protein